VDDEPWEPPSRMPTGTDTTDEQLVARMIGGDQDALASLYDRRRSVVFALALRILRDRAEAEEALADVFHQAWRHAAAFDPGRGTVIGWLFNLCRSRAIDRVRARGRRDAGLAQMTRAEEGTRVAGAAASVGPEEAADVAVKRRMVGAALGSLSAAQRAAIELAYFEGLSHSEIAARLGEPLGTVKTRIRQGLLTLRDNLGAQFERG
jgi:RNA polymerase sigma-70 factor, ECF subfamily